MESQKVVMHGLEQPDLSDGYVMLPDTAATCGGNAWP